MSSSTQSASVSLFSLKGDRLDAKIRQYILDRLGKLRYEIRVTTDYNDGVPPREQLKSALKCSDIVLVLGGIGGPFSDDVVRHFSNIFNEKMVTNERLSYLTENNGGQTLSHAKLVTYQSRGDDEVLIVYFQGVMLLMSDPEAVRLSFEKIAVPLLERFNSRNREYRRRVVLRSVLDERCYDDALSQGVRVQKKARLTTFEIKLACHDWTKLLDYERKFIDRNQDEVIKAFQCDDIVQRVYSQINFEHIKTAVTAIEHCLKQYTPENVFICFNGGKDCTVLLHMAVAVLKKRYNRRSERYSCLYVECPDPFPSLTEFIERCEQYYDLDVVKIRNNTKEALASYLEQRPNMRACLMGTRRTDPHSQNLGTFQMTDPSWPQVMRVSPLLDWHYSDIWDYLLHLKVPYCDLYTYGFTSIGGYTNTLRNRDLVVDETNETYLPAHKLFDASKERLGRTS